MESLCGGLNAMPFRTEARKCNHWATGGLLELGSKFNATYMQMKCSFYLQANLALEKKCYKKMTDLPSVLEFFFNFIIKSFQHKTKVTFKRKKR